MMGEIRAARMAFLASFPSPSQHAPGRAPEFLQDRPDLHVPPNVVQVMGLLLLNPVSGMNPSAQGRLR